MESQFGAGEEVDWEAILAAEGMAAELPRDDRVVVTDNPTLEAGRAFTPDLVQDAEAQQAADNAREGAETTRRNLMGNILDLQ